jgi:hypothetical protein
MYNITLNVYVTDGSNTFSSVACLGFNEVQYCGLYVNVFVMMLFDNLKLYRTYGRIA